MRMGFGLHLEQTQKLIMTPELRQAIVILQLSTLELVQYLQQQLLENPVLELKEEADDKEAAESQDPVEETESFDVDWESYFHDGSDLGYIRSPREETREYSYENYLSEAPTLQEHLALQLKLALPEGRGREIGEFLIGNIDDHGYLRVPVPEVARYFDVDEQEVLEVLSVIQGFDPVGVGARDLAECLLIQLAQRGETNPYVQKIIQEHLQDLADGRIAKIARSLGVSTLEVQEAADIIKTLDPKPGRYFGNLNDVRYVVPDVVVERVGHDYVVLVNDASGPRLGISPLYKSLLRRDVSCDEETRKFIETKLNAAAWVIKSIEQRRLTLYRVVNCIVDFQRDFLEKGIKYLRPLNLRQVAEVLGMHESTVSRATANKYIQTPQGVFELKFFFASGVQNTGGTSTSAESIKKTIQEYVQTEAPKKPYTDQEITEHLKRQGIRISRRTVAKYRDELGILSAAKRRRY
ncbi:DNA-directed RNA polymerase subunit sigma-24 [Clostridiales bacterium PH28_bin88]|nr:DNA-directed RNA polymerase subunit sigma-24 [Clostridiales bacterium PH28_bin88]